MGGVPAILFEAEIFDRQFFGASAFIDAAG